MTPRLWNIGWPWNRTAWCNMNNKRFRLNYTETDKDSGDTQIDLDITFENPKDFREIKEKLNTFLTASGNNVLYVEEKSAH